MVELPQSFFGAYNPYTLPIYGDLMSKYKLDAARIWLNFGQSFHLGQVYFEGTPYLETLSKEEMSGKPRTWYTESSDGSTQIWANFGSVDPTGSSRDQRARDRILP